MRKTLVATQLKKQFHWYNFPLVFIVHSEKKEIANKEVEKYTSEID